MPRRNTLLDNLMHVLIREWGRESVEAALVRIAEKGNGTETFPLAAVTDRPKKRKATRLSAMEQLERAQVPEPQHTPLRELAMRFDNKRFLPSNADVREFLIMMGERPPAMKDRSEAFRRILQALTKFPSDRLDRLASSANHSGPSQLGPISDAISAVAKSLPRQQQD